MAKEKLRKVKARSSDNNEQDLVITDLLALKKQQISSFLTQSNLARSGTKEQLRSRIESSLQSGVLSLDQIVRFLDGVIPWGKQHVYLFNGPSSDIADWRRTDWVFQLLKQHKMGKYLNAELPLVLPEEMKISSILHDPTRLRITAIKRREGWQRNEQYDNVSITEDGDEVELRAFVRRVTRSLVAFEWDLVSNVATLQISQLPTEFDYADFYGEFFTLIENWFDRSMFTTVDLRPAIKALHALEEKGSGETRSHGINYRTLQGRRFEGKSASPTDPLLGEVSIDNAMTALRRSGVGHLGNFYWLPGSHIPETNPLDAECHVIVVAYKHRINFPTPNDEQTVRYVLSRIRSHCS
jgi:hypothetical protein